MARRPTLSSAISYRDPRAALAWLARAFGFETVMVITDSEDAVVHSEMRVGSGTFMVGGEWSEQHKSPQSLGGINTQSLHVQLDADLDGHCARARAAGATILQEPSDQFYGDRTYRAVDPEGHVWTFGQTVREVSREEAEKMSGLRIEGWA